MKKEKNDELLDLVDEDDNIVGTVWMSEAHKDPSKIHREVGVAVFNDLGEVLIQQRAKSKSDPLSWKVTAAGHISAGESPEGAIKREVYEELGIKINPIFVEKTFAKRVGLAGPKEARFVYAFFARIVGKPKLKLEKSEVADALWIKPAKLVEFSKQNDWDLKGYSHKFIMHVNETKIQK